MELWHRHNYRLGAVIFQPYIWIKNGGNELHSELAPRKCTHMVCKVPIGRLVSVNDI